MNGDGRIRDPILLWFDFCKFWFPHKICMNFYTEVKTGHKHHNHHQHGLSWATETKRWKIPKYIENSICVTDGSLDSTIKILWLLLILTVSHFHSLLFYLWTNFQKHTLPLFLLQVPGHLQIIISLLYSPLKFYYMINSPCFPDRKGAGNIKLSIMTFTTGIRPLLLQLTMKWLPPHNGLSSQLSEK